jgi:hypothetical protein
MAVSERGQGGLDMARGQRQMRGYCHKIVTFSALNENPTVQVKAKVNGHGVKTL